MNGHIDKDMKQYETNKPAVEADLPWKETLTCFEQLRETGEKKGQKNFQMNYTTSYHEEMY